MGATEFIATLIAAGLSMLGYFLRDAHIQIKDVFRAIDTLRKEVHEQNLIVASEYARKAELRGIEMQLDKFSGALFDKIDRLGIRVDERLDKLTTRMDDKIESVNIRLEKRIDDLDKDVYQQLGKKQDRDHS